MSSNVLLQIQLLEGYPDALINRRQRNYITSLYKHSPTVMAIQLLRAMIPTEILRNCSARGIKSGDAESTGIPREVLEAVERKFLLTALFFIYLFLIYFFICLFEGE